MTVNRQDRPAVTRLNRFHASFYRWKRSSGRYALLCAPENRVCWRMGGAFGYTFPFRTVIRVVSIRRERMRSLRSERRRQFSLEVNGIWQLHPIITNRCGTGISITGRVGGRCRFRWRRTSRSSGRLSAIASS